MKDSVMLLNARLQRFGIEVAAFSFGYKTYPTYFGSDYAYDAESDSIVQILSPRSDDMAISFETAADAYSSFAGRYPDKNICFYWVDRVSSSINNPTYELTGDSVDTCYISDHFFNQLSDEIIVVDGTFDSMLEGCFRTDHHWKIDSAYDAYASVADALGVEAVPVGTYERADWAAVPFYGSLSRSGPCLPKEADCISDYWFDASHLSVVVDGETVSADVLNHYWVYQRGEANGGVFTNRYAGYFHGDYGMLEIRNGEATSAKSLLIVGDSFSNNVERFFSENYSCVYVVDPRHFEGSIDDVLKDVDITDVLFLLGSTNLATEKMVFFA